MYYLAYKKGIETRVLDRCESWPDVIKNLQWWKSADPSLKLMVLKEVPAGVK